MTVTSSASTGVGARLHFLPLLKAMLVKGMTARDTYSYFVTPVRFTAYAAVAIHG